MSAMYLINILPTSCHSLANIVLLLLKTGIARFLHGQRALVYGPAQRDFDISTVTGFIPNQPLRRLPETFNIWEEALVEAQRVVSLGTDDSNEGVAKRKSSAQWRMNILKWPELDIASLGVDIRQLQRAHKVLAFLVHFFVHSIPPTDSLAPVHIPRSLAAPIVKVSRILGMPPVLTYADVVMWNYESINPDLPVSSDNIRFTDLLSGTEHEYNFYLINARVELRGVEILRIIEDYNNLPNTTDLTSIAKISRDLTRLVTVIEEITDILESTRGLIDQREFYFAVRPWWKGSDAEGPSSAGWIYDGVPGSDHLDKSGPSAGQSAVMHALDIFLDVDHKLAKKRTPAPSAQNKKSDLGFMERMRRYMPGKHREYLEHLVNTPRPLRDVARQIPTLRDPYNSAVRALKTFRDVHIRIACLYIINMSKSEIPAQCPAAAMLKKMGGQATIQGPARGTGGTELAPLLKAGRDATARTILQED